MLKGGDEGIRSCMVQYGTSILLGLRLKGLGGAEIPELDDGTICRTPSISRHNLGFPVDFPLNQAISGGDYIAPKGLGSNDKQGAPRRAVASGLAPRLTCGKHGKMCEAPCFR